MTRSTIAFVCLFLLASAQPASATPPRSVQAWGITGGSSATITLVPIDPATGAALASGRSQIETGSTFSPVRDLASDPLRNPSLIWAVRDSGAGNELIAVNPFREAVVSSVLIDAGEPVLSIAFDPTTGTLFGASTASLFTIDAFSGESTLVGQTESRIDFGLGFDGEGNLFGVGSRGREFELVAIDTSDASTIFSAPINTNGLVDLAANPADGTLLSLGPGIYDLVAINPADGAVTTIGPSLVRPSGFAFTAVPEPCSALMTLAAGVLLGGPARRRRRPLAAPPRA